MVVVVVFLNGKPKSQQNCINLHKRELVESVHHLCGNSFLAALDYFPSA